ncbi:MAG: DUF2089 domain-containing protein [Clostridiales bacterium]|jgi:hypothetical protein|nr:DUF2089 domain-containing protein [Clostridiales bacterium]
MAYELPAACPVCQERFHVSRLTCARCGSALEGDFELDRLSRLTAAQRQFVIHFLKCRGNIREMEKAFAISYPTVRARIDEIVTALGERPEQDEDAGTGDVGGVGGADGTRAATQAGTREDRRGGEGRRTPKREILERLARGEIDPETAKALIIGHI